MFRRYVKKCGLKDLGAVGGVAYLIDHHDVGMRVPREPVMTGRLDERSDNSSEFRRNRLAHALLHEGVASYRVQCRAEVVAQCLGLGCV